jgi:hypothetical protein
VNGHDCSQFIASVHIQPNIDEADRMKRCIGCRMPYFSEQKDFPALLAVAEQEMTERFGAAVNVPWPDQSPPTMLARAKRVPARGSTTQGADDDDEITPPAKSDQPPVAANGAPDAGAAAAASPTNGGVVATQPAADDGPTVVPPPTAPPPPPAAAAVPTDPAATTPPR